MKHLRPIILALLVFTVAFVISSTALTGMSIQTDTNNSTDEIHTPTPDEFSGSDTDKVEERTVVVEEYVVESIDGQNNTITIQAEIDDNVDTEGLTIRPNIPNGGTNVVVEADGEVVRSTDNTNVGHTLEQDASVISYTFSIEDPHQGNEFISEDVVFIRQYGIQFTDKEYTSGDSNIRLGGEVDYSSLHTPEDNLAIYADETTTSVVESNGHSVTVISERHSDHSQEVEAAERVSEMFSDDLSSETSTLLILPPDGIRTGGLAMGHTDDRQTLWVARHSSYELQHTTMHEVAHAHQDFATEQELRWFKEGSAEYIATLGISQETDNLNVSLLEFNEDWYYYQEDTDSVQLSDPSSWDRNAEYNRGEHVSYLIDISLRHHTDGDITIIDLIQWMNQQDSVSYDEFRGYIVENTDEEFGDRLDYYTETTEIIDISEETGTITGNDTVDVPE